MEINKLKQELHKNGFVLLKGFFINTKEFKEFKKYLLNFLNYHLNNSQKKIEDHNKQIKKMFSQKKNISEFLNDNINRSSYLSRLLSSQKLIYLIHDLFNKPKIENIIINNQRFRVQIPGNDKIANLPWHQDGHYNLVKNTNSIVGWISLVDISLEMGPMIFKKKSHIFGELKKIIINKKNSGIAYTVDLSNKKIKNLEEIQFETKTGDLVLIDMNCVHTSGVNNSHAMIKYSAQARYHLVNKFK